MLYDEAEKYRNMTRKYRSDTNTKMPKICVQRACDIILSFPRLHRKNIDDGKIYLYVFGSYQSHREMILY